MATDSSQQLHHHDVILSHHNKQIQIICDGLQKPENAGMILRLADAYGIEKVVFNKPEFDLTSKKLEKASRSTHKHISYTTITNENNYIDNLIENGFTLIAIEISKTSKPLYQMNLGSFQKIVLVVGAEKHGISETLLKRIEKQGHIPMFGKNSSMNVATALSIALYETMRP